MLIESKYRIITTDGYQTDENNILEEIIFPSEVKTLAAPSKVVFEGKTLNWIPSTAAALQELEGPNCIAVQNGIIKDYSALTTVKLDALTSIATSGSALIRECASLTSLSMESLESINTSFSVFSSLGGLTTVNFPKLKTTTGTSSNAVFNSILSLTDVVLGSEGNPVTSLWTYTFKGCTQSNLTITIYTSGGASLSGEPWGATNATIIYEEA